MAKSGSGAVRIEPSNIMDAAQNQVLNQLQRDVAKLVSLAAAGGNEPVRGHEVKFNTEKLFSAVAGMAVEACPQKSVPQALDRLDNAVARLASAFDRVRSSYAPVCASFPMSASPDCIKAPQASCDVSEAVHILCNRVESIVDGLKYMEEICQV